MFREIAKNPIIAVEHYYNEYGVFDLDQILIDLEILDDSQEYLDYMITGGKLGDFEYHEVKRER